MGEVTTNAKANEFTVVELDKDPFFDCKHGQINATPEHNVYQSWCNLKDKIASDCKDCKSFCKKVKPETSKTVWKLSVGWFDEDFSPHGNSGDWEQTFLSEKEAREMLDIFIKGNPNYEIWWSIYKIETLAEGHLERRDIASNLQ